MPKFTITFETPDTDAYESALNALAEIHGGYQPQVLGDGPEPKLIPNPETRDEFVRRKVFEGLTAQVVAHNTAKAAGVAAQRITAAAGSFQVGQ